jgi:hypothetical protein
VIKFSVTCDRSVVFSIQHYVIKFSAGNQAPPPIEMTATPPPIEMTATI